MNEHWTGEHPDTEELEALVVPGARSAPARAVSGHIGDCADCRVRLEELREVQLALEALPQRVPSPGFTERVMARVELPAPLHLRAWFGLREHAAATVLAIFVASATLGGLAVWGALQTGLLPEAATSFTMDALGGLVWSGILQIARTIWATGVPGAVAELLGGIGLTEALGAMTVLGVAGLAAAAAIVKLARRTELRPAGRTA